MFCQRQKIRTLLLENLDPFLSKATFFGVKFSRRQIYLELRVFPLFSLSHAVTCPPVLDIHLMEVAPASANFHRHHVINVSLVFLAISTCTALVCECP